jgi:hypothetical protein
MTGSSQVEMSVRLRLSAQRALIGQVTPNIRQIFIRYRPGYIELLAVIDGEVSEDDRQRMEEVTSEIVSDFPDIDLIVANCIRIDRTARAMQDRAPDDEVFACVYARAEA